MRFTLATVFLVPALIAAAPAHNDRVVVIIEDSSRVPTYADHSKVATKPSGTCFRVCFSEKKPCPAGWVSLEHTASLTLQMLMSSKMLGAGPIG